MRITTGIIFTQSTININKQFEQLYKYNEAVSSGKRINRPSDDPIDTARVLGYRTLTSSLTQYKKNIENGSTWLRYTEAALADAEQVFVDAKVLAEQMATGSYTEEQRTMLANQAEQLYDHLVHVANSRVVDRHFFAGFKTDTTPFVRDENYNIEYNGDNGNIQLSIYQGAEVTVNITGQQAFVGDTNVFDVLRDLRNALGQNDQAAVGEMLPKIGDAMTQIVRVRAFVGTAMREMEASKMMVEEFGAQATELLSNTEDVDIVDAVSKLKERQIAFEAALKSTALITDLSLVNYMK